MRTAINLPDVAVGNAIGKIKRGDVITLVEVGRASPALVACLERSDRLGLESPAARPLKNGSSVYVHHGTSRVAAKIVLLDNGALEAGKKAIAQLKLASPILAFLGDRFVVRDASEQHTIAGGMVLAPDRARFLDRKQQTLLAARALALDDVDLCVRSEIARRGFARRETLLSKSHFGADEIRGAFVRLRSGNEIVMHGDFAVESQFWQKLRNRAIAFIDEAHKQNPDRTGLDLRELRTELRGQQPDVFEALIADLCADNFIRNGSAIARTAHRAALPVELQTVETKIREALSKKPFDPLPRREIESDPNAQRVLRFLIESGEVTEIASDVVLLRENFERMKQAVADFIFKNGPATVSDLRQALKSSRRIMVPFLEKLDRQGVTHRIGDKRVLA